MHRLSLKYCDFPCSREAKARLFPNLQQHVAAMRKTARSYHELRRTEWASCVCKRAIHLKSTKLSPSDAFMTSEQKRMSMLMFSRSSKIGYPPRPLLMPTGYNVPRRSNQSLKSVPIWGERSSSHQWKKEGHEHAWEHSWKPPLSTIVTSLHVTQ